MIAPLRERGGGRTSGWIGEDLLDHSAGISHDDRVHWRGSTAAPVPPSIPPIPFPAPKLRRRQRLRPENRPGGGIKELHAGRVSIAGSLIPAPPKSRTLIRPSRIRKLEYHRSPSVPWPVDPIAGRLGPDPKRRSRTEVSTKPSQGVMAASESIRRCQRKRGGCCAARPLGHRLQGSDEPRHLDGGLARITKVVGKRNVSVDPLMNRPREGNLAVAGFASRQRYQASRGGEACGASLGSQWNLRSSASVPPTRRVAAEPTSRPRGDRWR